MPRSLVLANDRMHVSFDENYTLRDIFFPNVGQENHTAGEPCRTGVWFDGKFAWLDDPAWTRKVRYEENSLVGHVELSHSQWRLDLLINDVVDLDRAMLIRKVTVHNRSNVTSDVRLFFHYDFHIYGVEVGDTVFFDPQLKALIAYKGRRYFIGNTSDGKDVGLSSYAMGITELQGREGTWRDAEDGKLERYPVAQGSVDATLQLDLKGLIAGERRTGYHWFGAADSRTGVVELDEMVRERGPENFVVRTRDWWRAWRNCEAIDTGTLDGDTERLYGRSLLTVRSHISGNGAIVAATDWDIIHYSRDTYNYLWPRDGALVSIAMTRAGYFDISRRFFEFCQAIFRPFDGYFLHKFTPTGEVASTWHPWVGEEGEPKLAIQEDETGLVLHALWEYYSRTHSIEFIRTRYRPLVRSAADWMTKFVDDSTGLPKPSYDLWEERWGVHAFTVASVWAGLIAAVKFAELFNQIEIADNWRAAAERMRKAALERFWDPESGAYGRSLIPDGAGSYEIDNTLDASTLALALYGMVGPREERMAATVEAIEQKLWCNTAIGGLARYGNDTYQQQVHNDPNVPGNPWVLTTMWLAQYHAMSARTAKDLERSTRLIKWAEARATESGLLPEQVHPHTGRPLSVSPLTWSHAEYVRAVQEHLAAEKRLSTR